MHNLRSEINYYYTNLSDTQYRRNLWKDIILNDYELTKKRHEYLEKFYKQLENAIENRSIERKEALELANEIVHYSSDKIDKDGLIGLLPSFLGGYTTYYKYWNDVRNDLMRSIDRKFD